MVKVEFEKRDFIWIGLIVVLLGVSFGYAFGGSEPAVMGHDIGELEGVCLSNGTNCDVNRSYVDASVNETSGGASSGVVTGGCNFGSGWGTATSCGYNGVFTCAAGHTARAITYCAPSGICAWNSAGTYAHGYCIQD